jgi:hypothetical protein
MKTSWTKKDISTTMITLVSLSDLGPWPKLANILVVDQNPPPVGAPMALGWDGLDPDGDERRQMFLMDNPQRRRLVTRIDNRSPFPAGFMGGNNRDALGGKAHSPIFCCFDVNSL